MLKDELLNELNTAAGHIRTLLNKPSIENNTIEEIRQWLVRFDGYTMTEGFDLKPGDRFSFEGENRICTVTEIRDYGVQLNFRFEDTGNPGYTVLPQKLVKVAGSEARNCEGQSQFYLYVFFNQDSDDDNDNDKFHQLEKSIAEFNGKVELVKLEWTSVSAYKPKIRYNINTLQQCALTNSWGGMIVRLPIPKDVPELSKMLDELGYKREAKLILGK